ncbi:MAG: hypothetical protein V3S84_02715 [Dehalococcoidales bacterium]
MKQLYLSVRAFHRILKLGRTIADLANADIIKAHHLAEALQYRPRRMYKLILITLHRSPVYYLPEHVPAY